MIECFDTKMKYSSNWVNATSMVDIDKLENSISELEKSFLAKEWLSVKNLGQPVVLFISNNKR